MSRSSLPGSNATGARAIWTIGHGNRSIEEFVSLLQEGTITYLVDVRAFPGSRRHPHFGRELLQASLAKNDIGYLWEGTALGGRRKPSADSHHSSLRNDSFRAYADHMEAEEFAQGIGLLLARAHNENVAVMCAERLPWQCHRYLISDYLVASGHQVTHIVNSGKTQQHSLNSIARVREGKLIYDGATQTALALEG